MRIENIVTRRVLVALALVMIWGSASSRAAPEVPIEANRGRVNRGRAFVESLVQSRSPLGRYLENPTRATNRAELQREVGADLLRRLETFTQSRELKTEKEIQDFCSQSEGLLREVGALNPTVRGNLGEAIPRLAGEITAPAAGAPARRVRVAAERLGALPEGEAAGAAPYLATLQALETAYAARRGAGTAQDVARTPEQRQRHFAAMRAHREATGSDAASLSRLGVQLDNIRALESGAVELSRTDPSTGEVKTERVWELPANATAAQRTQRANAMRRLAQSMRQALLMGSLPGGHPTAEELARVEGLFFDAVGRTDRSYEQMATDFAGAAPTIMRLRGLDTFDPAAVMAFLRAPGGGGPAASRLPAVEAELKKSAADALAKLQAMAKDLGLTGYDKLGVAELAKKIRDKLATMTEAAKREHQTNLEAILRDLEATWLSHILEHSTRQGRLSARTTPRLAACLIAARMQKLKTLAAGASLTGAAGLLLAATLDKLKARCPTCVAEPAPRPFVGPPAPAVVPAAPKAAESVHTGRAKGVR